MLVTGANRGIGAALVRELLKGDVKKIYATARRPADLPDFADGRVAALALDINDAASVATAAQLAADVDVLLNNAGTAAYADVLESSLDTLTADMTTNYGGTLSMVRAFAPRLIAQRGGMIVNVLSTAALVASPAMPTYSASKAALHSLTQSLRVSLRPQGVQVVGVYPGPVDTDMTRDLDWEKASPEAAARIVVAGIGRGDSDIFPDVVSQRLEHLCATDLRASKVFEAAMKALWQRVRSHLHRLGSIAHLLWLGASANLVVKGLIAASNEVPWSKVEAYLATMADLSVGLG